MLRKMIYLQYIISPEATIDKIMDTRSLHFFLQLSDNLHFGRTSEICHISPSALSRSIKQMEESLGVQLLERDNRSVRLTHQGRLLQNYARDSLQQWDSFRELLLEGAHELQGEISIYCSVTASYSFLHDILSLFRREHPSIEIVLHTGDPAPGIARVLAGKEDITIAARPEKLPQSLAFRRITVSPLVFISSLTNITEQPCSASSKDWAEIPMILSEEGPIRDHLNQWFNDIDTTPNIYAQVAGHEAIVSMVSLGFGIGVVPKIVLDNSPLKGKVSIMRNTPKLPSYDVGFCTLNKRLKSPIIKAFWSQL